MTRLHRHIAFAAVLVQLLACSSTGEGTPDRDGGSSGSGGTGANTGGSGGASGTGGAGGEALPDAGLTQELPPGCAPSDMLFACDPLTNEGCDESAGEACEYGLDEYFTCYQAPNDVAEGGACDWEQGPYCKPTLTCDSTDPENPGGTCRRHCCSDDNCVSPQKCVVLDSEFGTLGVCR